ncbi:hypothetical protein CLAFUW4_04748, partial [Fulvia fulva]
INAKLIRKFKIGNNYSREYTAAKYYYNSFTRVVENLTKEEKLDLDAVYKSNTSVDSARRLTRIINKPN